MDVQRTSNSNAAASEEKSHFSLNLSDTNLIFMVLMLAVLTLGNQINTAGVVEAIRRDVTVWPYLPEAVHGVVSTRTFIVGARHFPGCGKAL